MIHLVGPKQYCDGRPLGFTLLELLVVLSIMALVAALGVSRMGSVYGRALEKTTLSDLVRMDGQARSLAAMRHEPVVLRIDLGKGRLQYEMNNEPVGQPLVLPSSMEIERFLSVRERKSSGEATVRIGSLGSGETYALKITRKKSTPHWILFAGQSGQPIQPKSTKETEEFFRVLKKNSPHAP